MAMGLDKGLQLVQQEPRPNGQHLLVFQFCPSVKQVSTTNPPPWEGVAAMASWLAVGSDFSHPPCCAPRSLQQLQNACGFRKIGWKVLEKGQEKWRWGFNRQGVKNAGIPIFYCPDLR